MPSFAMWGGSGSRSAQLVLCVRDNRNRTNNFLESFLAALRRRIQVSHPNLFTFLGHLQHVTMECMHNMARLTNGLNIRRPKKMNLINEMRIKACVSRFDSGHYTRMQFLCAVSCSDCDDFHIADATGDVEAIKK